jgi:drug/metabolite transporter, DME family
LSGLVVALLSSLLWAIGSVLVAAGVKRLSVVPLNLVRCLVSTALFWGLLPFFGGFRALATIPASTWVWLMVSVLGLLVIGDSLYFRSLDLAGVSWAMPVSSIEPLWAVLLAAALLGEPLSGSLLGGAALVIIGIIFVSRSSRPAAAEPAPPDPGLGSLPPEQSGTDRRAESNPRARRTGLLLALGASVAWAIGQVALKPATAGIHTVLVNSIRMPMGALIMLALTLIQRQGGELRRLDRRTWGIILVASLVGTGFATFFYIAAIQMVGAGRASVLTSTAPIMAIPFSVLWLQERPTRWTLFGTLLTTAGIALVA